MKARIAAVAVFLIFISVGPIFSQESIETGGAVPEIQSEPDVQWVWGEVVSADAQNKTIMVKYLDYETDQEKELMLNVDDKTTYENIKSIEEIKPKDVLSIDYIVNSEGKNIAKNISVERPDNTQGAQEENITEEKNQAPPVASQAQQPMPPIQ